MAPTVPRELSVSFGAYTIGGTNDNVRIDAGPDGRDRFTLRQTDTETEFSCLVLVAGRNPGTYDWSGSGASAFETECQALEAAVTDRRQRVRVLCGPSLSVSLLDLNPAGADGIDVRGEIERVSDDDANTGRSRVYRVTVRAGREAQHTVALAGEEALRDFEWSVDYNAGGVRTLTVSGEYTKHTSSGTTATEQYADQIAARVSAITTAIGGTWEAKPVSEQLDPVDLEDAVVRFRRVYEELYLAQSQAATDDADLVGQRLTVNVVGEHPGDTGSDVRRLVRVEVAYEAFLHTSASETARAKYAGTILPWLIAHARDVAGASAVALVQQARDYDDRTRRITARLTLLAAASGSTLSRSITTVEEADRGLAVVSVWTGDPLAAYVFQGPQVSIRRVTETTRRLGTPEDLTSAPTVDVAGGGGGAGGNGAANLFGIQEAGAPLVSFSEGGGIFFQDGSDLRFSFGGAGDGAAGAGASGAGGQAGSAASVVPAGQRSWVVLGSTITSTPLVLGDPASGYTLDVVDETRETVARLVVGVAANEGAGSAGSGQRSIDPGAVQTS